MKIIAVGLNYKEHVVEMGLAVPEEPVFFLMPETSILPKKQPFYYPEFSKKVQYEVELVVKINRLGKYIEEKFAHRYYDEIGVGIDFTARDIQNDLMKKGLPWEKSKAFDGSAPVGKFIKKENLPPVNNIVFHLEQNGKIVQAGNSGSMIFSIDKIISYVSQFFTLKIGDIIFTGTPVGVGDIQIGDALKAYIGDQELLSVDIK